MASIPSLISLRYGIIAMYLAHVISHVGWPKLLKFCFLFFLLDKQNLPYQLLTTQAEAAYTRFIHTDYVTMTCNDRCPY